MAAAQILFLDIPDSAAVDLAVTHAKGDPRTVRFSGLVNGVLRALARAKATALPETLAVTEDAPEWFRKRLVAAYGAEKATAILAAHRVEAPIDFSVNADPENWADRLGGIVLPTGTVRVEKLSAPVPELPGLSRRRLVGAGCGGQPAGPAARRRSRVARGRSVRRARRQDRATRVGRSAGDRCRHLGKPAEAPCRQSGEARAGAEIVAADLMKYEPSQAFDAVLLDAPCSSTGTVRRHPDVPWTKTPDDIEKLAEVQFRLLGRAVELVRPGGRVVFSNCSLDPAEGEALLERFLAGTQSVRLDPIRPGEAACIDPLRHGARNAEDDARRSRPRNARPFRHGWLLRRASCAAGIGGNRAKAHLRLRISDRLYKSLPAWDWTRKARH